MGKINEFYVLLCPETAQYLIGLSKWANHLIQLPNVRVTSNSSVPIICVRREVLSGLTVNDDD